MSLAGCPSWCLHLWCWRCSLICCGARWGEFPVIIVLTLRGRTCPCLVRCHV
ncbi:unnamed protein product, partial [Scytosiphon promiscuus]